MYCKLAVLKLRDPPASVSQVLGLKAFATKSGLILNLYYHHIFRLLVFTIISNLMNVVWPLSNLRLRIKILLLMNGTIFDDSTPLALTVSLSSIITGFNKLGILFFFL